MYMLVNLFCCDIICIIFYKTKFYNTLIFLLLYHIYSICIQVFHLISRVRVRRAYGPRFPHRLHSEADLAGTLGSALYGVHPLPRPQEWREVLRRL